MNPLEQYPGVRKALYTLQWIANGVLSIAGVVFTAQGTNLDALPKWYILALAIAPVLWTYLGLTASANVEPDPPAPPA